MNHFATQLYINAIKRAQNNYLLLFEKGELAAEAVRSEHDLILKIAIEGFEQSEVQAQTANFVFKIFHIIERWGEWPQWQSVLEDAQDLFKNNSSEWMKIKYWLAQICYFYRNFEDALDMLKELYPKAQNGKPRFAALISLALCNTYLAKGNVEIANQYGERALRFFPTDSMDLVAAAILNSLGLVAIQANDPKTAISHFEKAIKIWHEHQEITLLSRGETNLGAAFFQLSEYENATKCFEKAHTHLDFLNRPVDTLKAVNNLASIYYMQENFTQAVDVLMAAIEKSRHLHGIYHLRGSLNHNLGNALLSLKRFGDAEVYLMNTLQLWDRANDPKEKLFTIETLGELFQESERFEQAIQFYSEAVSMGGQYLDSQGLSQLEERCKAGIRVCEARLL